MTNPKAPAKAPATTKETMSNEVWVRWKDSISNDWLFDKVVGLKDDSLITDLRKAFAKQQEPDIRPPAAVTVRETENGETLKASTKLADYFVPPADSVALPGPGKSEETALFLTIPPRVPSRKRAADYVLDDIDTVVKALPSASSFAHGQWASRSADDRLVYHRPNPNPSVVPVELRLPVFARFVENASKQNIVVSDETMRSIEEFLSAMCASFDNEDLRASKARELLGTILGVTINKAAVLAGTTDGSFLSGGAHVGFIMNLEVKNELGQGGGDPFLQNWNYQAKFWADNRNFPGPHASFTVILSGPNIGICGAITTKSSAVQEWLTPLLPMNVSPLSAKAAAVVRVLAALRVGINELRALASVPTSVPEVPCIELADREERLEVVGPLENRILLYHGRFGPQDVVLKICRVYCIDAHRALAENDMAPPILWHGEVAGWEVVVMGFIKSGSAPSDTDGMKKVIELLHKSGFVHGDARRSNFLFGENGKPYLIDFDTSGKIGHTYYQPFLNPNIDWPGQAGSPVLPQHDFEMLESL